MYELNLLYKTFRFDDCICSFLQVTGCNYTDMFVLRALFHFDITGCDCYQNRKL